MAATRLRAVALDEKPPKPGRKSPPLTITQAAAAGNQRELLVAMRARIAKTVEDTNCPPRDLAALTRRLQDINHEIEALDVKARQEADEDAVAADEEFDAEAL